MPLNRSLKAFQEGSKHDYGSLKKSGALAESMGGYQELLKQLKAQDPTGAWGSPRERSAYENAEIGLQGFGMLGVPGLSDAAGLAGDAMMFARDPESRTPLNFGLSALGALPFIPSLGGMTAFHGTPHRFTNATEDAPHGMFDLSKIGTGEGAQAYGHGIYLAENPGVAGSYKQQGDGNLYTVDLPDEQIEKMLDWDRPISEQPYIVERLTGETVPSVKALDAKKRPDGSWDVKTDNGEIHVPEAKTAKEAKRIGAEEIRSWLAEDLLPDDMRWMTGEEYATSSGLIGDDAEAVSAKLAEMGIPGLRYLDANSRAADEGTRNFVVFDPSITKILGRE